MHSQQKRELKAKAHQLKPVVIIGQHGVTEAVINETDIALKAHELIKIKDNSGERSDRKALAAQLCQQLNAECVQIIGKTIVLYRNVVNPFPV